MVGGIARLESFGKLAQDPGIFLFERDGQRQHFLFVRLLNDRSMVSLTRQSAERLAVLARHVTRDFTIRDFIPCSSQHAPEFFEEVLAVVRPGGCLGMILDAEDGQTLVPHPFERLVVQVDMGQLDVAGKGRRVDGEPVVLSRDLDLAGLLVPDGVVGASVAELELERRGAEGLAQKLVAQADPEDRNPASFGGGADQCLERVRSPCTSGRGSPGPLEMKMPSGRRSRIASADAEPGMTVTLQPISTRCRRMFRFMPKSSATTCGRSSTGVVSTGRLATCWLVGVERRQPKRVVQTELPGARLARHDLACQVPADQARAGLGLGHQAGVVGVDRREDSLHRSALARSPHQRAGVDPRDSDDAVSLRDSRRAIRSRDSCSPGR